MKRYYPKELRNSIRILFGRLVTLFETAFRIGDNRSKPPAHPVMSCRKLHDSRFTYVGPQVINGQLAEMERHKAEALYYVRERGYSA